MDLVRQLGLNHPLIVAPMAGPSSVDLVVASSRAGALGSIGAAYSTPADIRDFVTQVRAKTDRPFAINLFCPHSIPPVSAEDLRRANEATAVYREEFGIAAISLSPPYEEDFEAQFATVLELRPAVLSFVFGLLSEAQVTAARRLGILLIGTATSPDEAEALAASRVDAITLQGIEGGGHRGIFNANRADPEIPMLDLLRECSKRLTTPLIAAGGIMNHEQIQGALASGAQAVQMGTAFLACEEAGTSAPYREALAAPVRDTKTTRVFSGRLARGIRNRFMSEMENRAAGSVLPFPAQNKFTRDLRGESLKRGSADFLSLWAGTGTGRLWTGACAELISELFPE